MLAERGHGPRRRRHRRGRPTSSACPARRAGTTRRRGGVQVEHDASARPASRVAGGRSRGPIPASRPPVTTAVFFPGERGSIGSRGRLSQGGVAGPRGSPSPVRDRRSARRTPAAASAGIWRANLIGLAPADCTRRSTTSRAEGSRPASRWPPAGSTPRLPRARRVSISRHGPAGRASHRSTVPRVSSANARSGRPSGNGIGPLRWRHHQHVRGEASSAPTRAAPGVAVQQSRGDLDPLLGASSRGSAERHV